MVIFVSVLLLFFFFKGGGHLQRMQKYNGLVH